jgi:ribose transport system permease protein
MSEIAAGPVAKPTTPQEAAGAGTHAGVEDFIATAFPFLLLAVMIGWLAIAQPSTMSFGYIQNAINLSMVLVLIAFGQSIVTLTGGMDLSVAGLLSVVTAIAATQMTDAKSTAIVTALLILLGWVPGVINGVLIVRGRMQPFIVTLATWFVWGGLAFYILPGPGGAIDPMLPGVLINRFLGLSGTSWLLVILVVFALYFSRTRLGLSIRAIGSDRTSALHSGIRADATEIAAYALSSWFAVLAGIVLSYQSLSGEPTVGNTYVLPMITAVVVGGVSLLGGKGSLLGGVIGALVLTYLTGVTFSFRLQPQWNQIFQGLLLVFSISMTYLLQQAVAKYRERRRA